MVTDLLWYPIYDTVSFSDFFAAMENRPSMSVTVAFFYHLL